MFHTVGENFIPISLTIENIYEKSIEVTAFPNPFNSTRTIKVKGKEYGALELSVFDVSGRLMTENEVLLVIKSNCLEAIYKQASIFIN